MRFGKSLLAIAAALILTGCGSNDRGTGVAGRNESVTPSSAQSAPAAEQGGTPGAVLPPSERDGPPERGGTPPMPQQVVRNEVPEVRVEEVARNLEVPWDIAFAPDGRMFVTERPGRIRVARRGEALKSYLELEQVVHRGEGGLMGLALHPRFPEQPYLYVMYTARTENGPVNRISRFTDAGDTAQKEQVLIDDIPAAQFHDGGALDFGPDAMLYAGTGDAREPALSQDPSSLAGKILRVTAEGKVPQENPFAGSPIWAYGFRNVTGLAWHPQTRELWAASHGPSGEFAGLRAKDAVYVVRKGGNHGWPVVVGTTGREGIESPILYYPEEAVPPGGAMFYSGRMFPQFRGDLFLTSLRAEHLQRVVPENGKLARIERWWPEKYGRLRAITEGPDGAIYVSTSNQDGRAERPYPGGDFIYRLEAAGNPATPASR